MTLDGVAIFKGEIAKACGGILGGVDAFGDVCDWICSMVLLLKGQFLDDLVHHGRGYLGAHISEWQFVF